MGVGDRLAGGLTRPLDQALGAGEGVEFARGDGAHHFIEPALPLHGGEHVRAEPVARGGEHLPARALQALLLAPARLLQRSPAICVGAVQARGLQVGASSSRDAKLDAHELGVAQIRVVEVGMAQIRTGKVDFRKVLAAQVNAFEIRSDELSRAEINIAQIRAREIYADKSILFQVEFFEFAPGLFSSDDRVPILVRESRRNSLAE